MLTIAFAWAVGFACGVAWLMWINYKGPRER